MPAMPPLLAVQRRLVTSFVEPLQYRALTTGACMTNPPGDLQSRALSPESIPPHVAPPSPSAASGARERLAKAIIAACNVRPESDDERATKELRASVDSYVATLRSDGATVEHAVIATKELLAETMGGPNIPTERRALAEQVVSWGIEAYYDASTRAD
jgi:hypothetical protein